jgi:hypothetical protein
LKNKSIYKKIKQNKFQSILIFLIIFAMLMMFSGYGTYSKYAKTVSSTESVVTVAKFNPSDKIKDGTASNWSSPSTRTDEAFLTSGANEKTYYFTITNNSEVTVEAKVVFDENYKNAVITSPTSNPIVLSAGGSSDLTIKVHVPTSASSSFASNTVKFHIEYKQVD